MIIVCSFIEMKIKKKKKKVNKMKSSIYDNKYF